MPGCKLPTAYLVSFPSHPTYSRLNLQPTVGKEVGTFLRKASCPVTKKRWQESRPDQLLSSVARAVEFAFCSILKQKDDSIPSQVPRNNATEAAGMCLRHVEYMRVEDKGEHKIFHFLFQVV